MQISPLRSRPSVDLTATGHGTRASYRHPKFCPNRTPHLRLPLKLKANFRKPSGYFMPPNCTLKNGSNDSFFAIYIYLTTIKQFFPLTTSGPSPSAPVSVNSSALHLHSEGEPVTHPWPSSLPTGPVNHCASDS